ncbi:MAG: hypothetical protein KGY56_03570 [Desulfobacterales bacterium]|nr:hypothetical protein [Desulfobacterales bacterium]
MASNVAQRRKEIENQIIALRRQADEMDARIRAYLADRQNKPHPHHQEFIEKVQKFRIDPSVSTKYLETQLDNLQWKVYYASRAWRQLWDNADATRRDESRRQQTQQQQHSSGQTHNSDNRRIYSVDRLWEIQQEKLGGDSAAETKDGFVQRIKERYGRLASEKSSDEEIVMSFDKKSGRCDLSLKKRDYPPEH